MKKLFLLLTLFAVTIVLTGCETLAGIGKDLENAGTAITDAAQ